MSGTESAGLVFTSSIDRTQYDKVLKEMRQDAFDTVNAMLSGVELGVRALGLTLNLAQRLTIDMIRTGGIAARQMAAMFAAQTFNPYIAALAVAYHGTTLLMQYNLIQDVQGATGEATRELEQMRSAIQLSQLYFK